MARVKLIHQSGDGEVASVFNSAEEALAQAAEDYVYGARKHRVEDGASNVVHDPAAVHAAGKERAKNLQAELDARVKGR